MSRRQTTRKQKQKRKVVIVIIELLVLLLLLSVLYVAVKLSRVKHETVVKENLEISELDEHTEEAMEGYTTFAVFGLDNRSNGNFDSGNSDVIMVVSIDNKTKDVKIASVYRDSYLEVTENGTYGKINSALARNHGAEGLISALDKNLDLNITDYVTVDWYAVVQAVDLLGGVDIELTSDEATLVNRYGAEAEGVTGVQSSRTAKDGMNHLDGIQALSYARIRHLAGGDFARTERQRIVVAAMLEKAKKSDVATLNKMVDEMLPNISTSLSTTEILSLAKDVFSYNLGDTTGFPSENQCKTITGAGSCVIPVDLVNNVSTLHQFLFENTSYVPSKVLTEISNNIVNQTGLHYTSTTEDSEHE